MTIWERRYGDMYGEFIKTIIDWNPDFIVPVARKSCKLFISLESLFEEIKNRIYYKEYFEFVKVNLDGKKIAIVDDAVRTTSTLKKYRDFFVERGVSEKNIRTYGFIGRDQLQNDPLRKYDKNAIIPYFASPVAYKEYLTHQSNHLILKTAYQDIDHLVLQTEVAGISSRDIEEIWDFLAQWGYRYRLESIQGIERFGIHCPSFFSLSSIISDLNLPIEHDFVEKIRFVFLEKERKLLCVPMIFPKLSVINGDLCKLASIAFKLPFKLPCQNRGSHPIDELCYLSICLLINSFLARKFLFALRESSPRLYHLFENIGVKRSGLTRYLGEDIGEDISSQIKRFIKKESLPLDSITVSDSDACSHVSSSSLPFSRKNVPIILRHLRNGYENAVKMNDNDLMGVKYYTKPVKDLLEMDEGIHPLMFTEVLDELCDLGVIVPVTEYNNEEKCWRRTYRTGEDPHDTLPWERSQWILPLAIQTLATVGVQRMYLEKTMANFCYDFPLYTEQSMKNRPENHSFITKPSYFGAQVFVIHPMSHEMLPLSPEKLKGDVLDKWKEFAIYFGFDRPTKKFVSLSSLKGITQILSPGVIRDYFKFMAQLKEKFGRVDALNTLAFCRSNGWFYLHLMYNINRWKWSGSYGDFLRKLSGGEIRKDFLNFAGQMASSADQKINNSKDFPFILEKCKQIADNDPASFEDIWYHCIKPNVRDIDYPLLEIPCIKLASDIVGAMRTLDGITRLKLDILSSSKKARTEEKVLNLGPQEFHNIGISTDIACFLKGTHSQQEIYRTLSLIHEQIVEKIKELPEPKNEKDLTQEIVESGKRRLINYSNLILPSEERIIEELIDECLRLAVEQWKMEQPLICDRTIYENGKVVVKLKDVFGKELTAMIKNNRITRMRETKP